MTLWDWRQKVESSFTTTDLVAFYAVAILTFSFYIFMRDKK